MGQNKKGAALLSLFTSDRSNLGKNYTLDLEGKVQKETVASMDAGTVCIIGASDLNDLIAILDKLKSNQALGYGVPYGLSLGETCQITTQRELNNQEGKIARDKNHFKFLNGPGILMFDCDYSSDCELTPDETRQLLLSAVPELCTAPMLWCQSSSSYILNSKTGEPHSSLRGQRFYVMVADARDIPRVGDLVFKKLILNGHGYIIISISGQLLTRTIIDQSVFKPERLDFGSKATCQPPIEQQFKTPIIWNGNADYFDTTAIKTLSEIENCQYQTILTNLKGDKKNEQEKIKSQYIHDRAIEFSKHSGISNSEAEEYIKRALEGGDLCGKFLLYPHNQKPVTVEEILKDPIKWHDTRFADPLEPNYRNDPRVAWFCSNRAGAPRIYSHAHGLHYFSLVPEKKIISIFSGHFTSAVDETLDVMRSSGKIYDYGDFSMARISNDHIYPISKNDSAYLKDFAERNATYERPGEKGLMYNCNVPTDVIGRILAKNGERNLPKLNGLLSAPTIKLDGSIIQIPGYDEPSGLYLQIKEHEFPIIPDQITDDDILYSTKSLLEPFEQFSFAGTSSRSVLLAALLTATVRTSVKTRPAFAFDAPSAGSGKTLLGSCVSALGGGTGATQPAIEDDDELRKVFTTLLRQGASDIFLDNVIGILDGAAINHLLTAPIYQGRILGQSETISVPNNAILLLTGNNLRIHKDLMRRVLVCRLDTGLEKPYTKHYSFCPLGLIKADRMGFVRHALIIIKGCLARTLANTGSNLGSFEEWDYLVRRSILIICELIKQNPTYSSLELSDPIEEILNSSGHDPETATIDLLLRGMHGLYQNQAEAPRTIYENMHSYTSNQGNSLNKTFEEMIKEALETINDDFGGKLTPRRFGAWLLNRKDRVIGSLKLVGIKDTKSQGYIWRAVPV